jgi:hypothetical protein
VKEAPPRAALQYTGQRDERPAVRCRADRQAFKTDRKREAGLLASHSYHPVLAVQTLRTPERVLGESRGRASLDRGARRDPKDAGNLA